VCSREKEGSALPWRRPYVSFIIDVHIPLYRLNEHFFDAIMFAKMKRGAYIINTARGKLVERDAVVRALKSAHVARYAGDVWPPSRRSPDHSWRTLQFDGTDLRHVVLRAGALRPWYAAILQSYFVEPHP
jgi:formate dehydrogenase